MSVFEVLAERCAEREQALRAAIGDATAALRAREPERALRILARVEHLAAAQLRERGTLEDL